MNAYSKVVGMNSLKLAILCIFMLYVLNVHSANENKWLKLEKHDAMENLLKTNNE